MEYESGDFCKNSLCDKYPFWKAGQKQYCAGCKAKAFHQYLDGRGFKITKEMGLNEYQKAASHFMNPQCSSYAYLGLGLAGEAGEVADKLKRLIRGDGLIDDCLLHEIGDCLWYLSQLSDFFKVSFEEIAQMNIEKLTAREAAGTITGSGDNR